MYGGVSLAYLRDRYADRLRALHRQCDPEELDPDWQKGNAKALDNFASWFSTQLMLKKVTCRRNTWSVIRTDETLPYGPANCEIVERKELLARNRPRRVTKTLVAAIKEYLQDHPNGGATTEVAKVFRPYSYSTIYRIIKRLGQQQK
jgi:hypothetical protein